MSVNTEKAKKLLETMNKDFTELCRAAAEETPLDKDAFQIYRTTAEINVLTSQLIDKDEPKTYEGDVTVNNQQAMVSIQGIELRGNMEFEIFHGGKWVSGCRDNSQYGQVFYTNGVGVLLILSDGVKGRVSLPLKMHRK